MNNPNDLISRNTAIKWFFRPYSNEESYSNLDIEKALKAIPTVDAVPVVHGRWRELKDGTEECTNCLGLCPHEENYNGDVIFNFGCEYCPWCGAKMDADNPMI